MTTLTPAQVAEYCIKAGFGSDGNRDHLVNAVSVALAESGGNTAATHTNRDKYRSKDRGLFQINNHWHPEVSDAAAYDPAQAAAAAYRISHAGADWSSWSTWPAKAALEKGRATLACQQAVNNIVHEKTSGGGINPLLLGPLGLLAAGKGNVDLNGVPNPVADVGHAVASLAVIAEHAGAWMADWHNWLRVLMVIGGAAAVIVGGVLLAESGAAGSTAQSAARTTTKAAGEAAGAAAIL